MFLFNVQPLNPDINSFIVHIRPSNRRKGDIKIIEILNHITNIEKKMIFKQFHVLQMNL